MSWDPEERSAVLFIGEFGQTYMGSACVDRLCAPFMRKPHLVVQKVTHGEFNFLKFSKTSSNLF